MCNSNHHLISLSFSLSKFYNVIMRKLNAPGNWHKFWKIVFHVIDLHSVTFLITLCWPTMVNDELFFQNRHHSGRSLFSLWQMIWILYIVSSYIFLATVVFIYLKFWTSVIFKQIVQEYERAVIFRLGRLLPGGARGPGIINYWLC